MPYEAGISRYRELARGHILGEAHGLLKLLVSLEHRTLLGVHPFGAGATELVRIGHYPTLAEAYKVAALDAANKLRALAQAAR